MHLARSLLLLLLLTSFGCTAVGSYLRDRGADAADVLILEGSVGLGLAVDVKAGEALHLGLGYADVRKGGLRGREAVWLRDREVGLPLSLLFWVGALRDGQLSRLGHLHANVDELWHTRPWRWGDIEAGAFLGVVGVRVGVSLVELLDLLVGLVGLDPLGDDRGLEPEPEDLPQEEGVWLVGDLHDHCRPPDREGHATSSATETAELAASNGLDFVGINPHLWNRGRSRVVRGGKFARFVAELTELAQRDDLPLIVPGFEATFARDYVHWGDDPPDADPTAPDLHNVYVPSAHALLLFRELEQFAGLVRTAGEADNADVVRRWLREVPREERLWIPTHPMHERLAVPFFPDWAVPWPGLNGAPPAPRFLRVLAESVVVREEPRDDAGSVATLSEGAKLVGTGVSAEGWLEVLRLEDYEPSKQGPLHRKRAWVAAGAVGEAEGDAAHGGIFDVPIDGLEAISGLLHLAESAVGRAGEELAWEQVFATLDRLIRRDRRRYSVLAGSDNHRDLILPTLWVFAVERSTAAVFDALRLGRVCVGGEAARWFRARGDLDPGWRWVGSALAAERQVELRWRGAAELFVDGESRGRLRDGYLHTIEPGSFHAYRIVSGRSHSAWIYVNLPR